MVVTVFYGCSVDTGQEEVMKTVPTSEIDHSSYCHHEISMDAKEKNELILKPI